MPDGRVRLYRLIRQPESTVTEIVVVAHGFRSPA
jgi:hypothetical protein